jgi:hypothetical protein
VAQAFVTDQTNQTEVSAGLSEENQAISKTYAQYYANQNASDANLAQGLAAAIPAPTSGGGQTGTAAQQYNFQINTTAFAADIGSITANGVPNVNNAISQLSAAAIPPGGYTTITTFDSATWKFTFAADPSDAGGTGSNIDVNVQPVNGQNTPNTTSATLWGIADNTLWFMYTLFGVSTAYGAGRPPDTSPDQQARIGAAAQAFESAQVPYVRGGITTAGADCSGSIDAIYAAAGTNIGHMVSSDFPHSPLFAPVTGPPEIGDVGWYPGHVVMYGGNLGTGPDGGVLNVWSASQPGGPVFGAAESKWYGTPTWFRYVGH